MVLLGVGPLKPATEDVPDPTDFEYEPYQGVQLDQSILFSDACPIATQPATFNPLLSPCRDPPVPGFGSPDCTTFSLQYSTLTKNSASPWEIPPSALSAADAVDDHVVDTALSTAINMLAEEPTVWE